MNEIRRRSPTVWEWVRTLIDMYARRHTLVQESLPGATKDDALAGPVDPLSPRGIADATARLLWVHRGSLKVETTQVQRYNHQQIGEFAPADRSNQVTMPGGIRLTISQTPTTCSIVTPDGQQQHVSKDDFGTIDRTWRAIQAMNMMEALGMEVPDMEEPQSGLGMGLAHHIAAIVETSDPQRIEGVYTSIQIDNEQKQTERELPCQWRDLGGGVWFDATRETGYSMSGETRGRLLHPTHGVMTVPYEPIGAAHERRRLSSFAQALGIAREQPVHLPMPKGNAQAARILRICREAVAAEPELVDAKGTPIAPLVNRHLPDLMRIHAKAAEAAPAEQLAEIDAELMRGIEAVRRAVDEALTVSANLKRDALRTQLRFLEMRHPEEEASGLLPIE